jgi:hypothetical protein
MERLATRVQTYLQENKFEVAFSKDPTAPASWFFIQARKSDALRTVAGARRSTDITVRGSPNDVEVTIGTGEWGKNIITSAPLFIVPVVGITATLAKLYVAKKFEDNLWRYIKDQAKFLKESSVYPDAASSTSSSSSSARGTASSTTPAGAIVDRREYESDYVEGYPGWNTLLEGTLTLERQKGGKNQITFRYPEDPSKQIVLPAALISEAKIITRKTGRAKGDLLIQLDCKDASGKTVHPVFNINDDIIRGVLAGINELVGEDKLLKEFQGVSVTTATKYCSSCGAQLAADAKFCSSCGQKLVQ